MQAGKLRHRIDIQELKAVRDPVTLEFGEPEWVTRWEKCPARVEDLSARDFIAAQAGQAQATSRMVIRYRPGVLATMRILYRGEVYSIVGPPLADAKSGLDYLTILVEKGVKDG
ncbi:phage head closure protein [Pseudomonas alloputida]|jgi:SPP1 family predicted phage head-tail adaptor|uniref:Phage head closure protein n=1 Tax=Pseudomonas alloputida TaxID=1940621 RepID=A0AAW7HP90_9PSED|nr:MULTISPECIES: phage head closure protein [Pseudomonas]QEQ90504.1 phage head closure protein [Pseudomonas putida]MCE0865877.1 phage head closure protein [Pseudomonas alloputida]MCE0869262.1 phage head closure protein [Pseudomonas alloputida]MCE0894864.1 phage head closure protein [Pseudomonas alloputida]MCE0924148.1 phage head closure protein [Pseudomonas alloputida]